MRIPQEACGILWLDEQLLERSNFSCVFSVILKTPFYHKI